MVGCECYFVVFVSISIKCLSPNKVYVSERFSICYASGLFSVCLHTVMFLTDIKNLDDSVSSLSTSTGLSCSHSTVESVRRSGSTASDHALSLGE